METVLVTGGSGLLGSYTAKFACSEFKVKATYLKHYVKAKYDMIPCDVTNERKVTQTIRKINPDVVIHTAALTNVDYCEAHKEEAYEINVEGTKNVAEACKKIGAKMIYVSTDFVFDGKKGMYKEDDKVNPVNYYGLTKLEGEKIVKETPPDYVIGRVSVLYGWNFQDRQNFVTWVIEMLRKKERIKIVTDQYTSPSYAKNTGKALLRIYKKDVKGIFHVSGRERINRYDFAKKIAEVFGLDDELIIPITTNELTQKAKRPMDSSLDVNETEKKLVTRMLSVSEGLKNMRDEVK